MPALLLLGVGAAGGFFLAKGVDETAGLVKWVAIGGAVFVAGKYLKAF